MTPFGRPPPLTPWTDPAIADALYHGWTTDPRNIADAERLVAALRSEEPEARSVLDYGCGTGRLAAWFDRRVYVGYDPSPAMLAVARRAYPQHRFVQALRTWQEADAVICNSVVQYLEDDAWRETLRDIAERSVYVSMIETYDLAGAAPTICSPGGSDTTIYLRCERAYRAALGGIGIVDRHELSRQDDGRCLSLYVMRQV